MVGQPGFRSIDRGVHRVAMWRRPLGWRRWACRGGSSGRSPSGVASDLGGARARAARPLPQGVVRQPRAFQHLLERVTSQGEGGRDERARPWPPHARPWAPTGSALPQEPGQRARGEHSAPSNPMPQARSQAVGGQRHRLHGDGPAGIHRDVLPAAEGTLRLDHRAFSRVGADENEVLRGARGGCVAEGEVVQARVGRDDRMSPPCPLVRARAFGAGAILVASRTGRCTAAVASPRCRRAP